MGFPTANPVRKNRRRLGRNQSANLPYITVTAAPSASTVIFTFSAPVVVTGPLHATVAARNFVSQVVNSPTQVTVTFDGTVATKAWTIDNSTRTLGTYQGGVIAASAGTFP